MWKVVFCCLAPLGLVVADIKPVLAVTSNFTCRLIFRRTRTNIRNCLTSHNPWPLFADPGFCLVTISRVQSKTRNEHQMPLPAMRLGADTFSTAGVCE